jgi:dienelactone hydrolase
VLNRVLRLLAALPLAAALVLGLPLAAQAQPSGGNLVEFTAIDDGTGKGVALRGMLWLPPGAAKGAVVLLHGAGGWTDFREGHYGRELSAAGYAVLAVDSFGPRGVGPNLHHYRISFAQMARDAFAARSVLIERGFAPQRLAVMGLSKGGTAALYAVDRALLSGQTDRFPVAVVLYPPCHVRARVPSPASSVFMGLGEKDDLTGAKQCQEIAHAYEAAGGKVVVRQYPDAAHGFDGNPANTVLFYASSVERFTECTVIVEADGQESYAGKTYAVAGGEAIIADMRKSCIKTGASFWTNPRQKEAVLRDVIDFLNKALTS